MIDFNNFEYSKDKTPANYLKKNMFFEELKDKFYEEIKKSESHKDYFAKFDQDSVELFMRKYAERKANLAEYYEYYINNAWKTKEIKFKDDTEDIMNLIKHKKLFNLQLQWKADKVKIKEINMSYDFQFWESYIDACPFIPQITEGEILVMKQFLKRDDVDYAEWRYCQWQNYSLLMEKNETGDFVNMPEWYKYYDTMMGTGELLFLPDIRSKKEEYYCEYGREELSKHRVEEAKLRTPAEPYVSPPPSIFSGSGELASYAETFEADKHFVELFKLWKIQCTPVTKDSPVWGQEIEEALELLEEADFPVIMPGGYEWREAIVRCARQYKNNIIADELDAVYEEYCMLADLGISKGTLLEEIWDKYRSDLLAELHRDMILYGRKALGEPMDFNF